MHTVSFFRRMPVITLTIIFAGLLIIAGLFLLNGSVRKGQIVNEEAERTRLLQEAMKVESTVVLTDAQEAKIKSDITTVSSKKATTSTQQQALKDQFSSN